MPPRLPPLIADFYAILMLSFFMLLLLDFSFHAAADADIFRLRHFSFSPFSMLMFSMLFC
jgi:hypothetical protein